MTAPSITVNDLGGLASEKSPIRFANFGGLSLCRDVSREVPQASTLSLDEYSDNQTESAGLVSEIYNLLINNNVDATSENVKYQLEAIPLFLELLESPMLSRYESPIVSFDSDGEINAEWLGSGGKSFTFSLNDKGRLIYSLYTPNGRKLFGETRSDDDLGFFEDFIRTALG